MAPQGPMEEMLATIWQDVLGRSPVGVHDSFFDLGGHSLLAVVICSRITHLLGVEVPARWVFESPTIEGLRVRMNHTMEILSPPGPSNRPPAGTAVDIVRPAGDVALATDGPGPGDL